MHPTKRYAKSPGFTLLELLSVVAVIAIASGIIGLSLTGRSDGMSLNAGQRVLISTFHAARTNAILKNRSSRVVFCNIPADPRYLRFLGILVEDPANSDRWKALDSGVYLPDGVYLVPDTGGRTVSGLVSGTEWEKVRSDYTERVLTMPSAFPYFEYETGVSVATNNNLDWIYYEFSATGRPRHQEDNRFLLANGSRSVGSRLRLFNPGSVVGIKVRRYGNITALTEAAEFVIGEDEVDE